MMPKMIRNHCAISAEGEKLLEKAITRFGLRPCTRAHRAAAFERDDSVPNTGPFLWGLEAGFCSELACFMDADLSLGTGKAGQHAGTQAGLLVPLTPFP